MNEHLPGKMGRYIFVHGYCLCLYSFDYAFPIGGIVADRVNKRNIMVGLDFLRQPLFWSSHSFWEE